MACLLVILLSSVSMQISLDAGLILWNQTRQRWVGNKKSENQTKQPREPKLRCE